MNNDLNKQLMVCNVDTNSSGLGKYYQYSIGIGENIMEYDYYE